MTGDAHIGLNTDSYIEENGLELKVNEIFKQFDYMVDYAIENKFKYFFHNGDLFQSKNPIPILRGMLTERLYKLDEAGIITRLLLGNHTANNSSKSALYPIDVTKYKHLKVVEKIICEQINEKLGVIYIPHIVPSKLKGKSFDEFLIEKVNKIISLNPNLKFVIVGHLSYKGCVVGSEEVLLESAVNFFPEVPKKKINKVFLSHIHKFQLLKRGDLEIIYPGSIVRCDFGERNEEKGFVVYDFEKNDWKFKKLNTVGYKQINIDLVNKNTVSLNEEKIKKSVSGKIVKLVINTSEENRRRFDLTEIKSVFSKYCYVSKTKTNVVRKEREEVEVFDMNPESVVKNHIKNNIDKSIRKELFASCKETMEIVKSGAKK
jgi:exonuclease SbcD